LPLVVGRDEAKEETSVQEKFEKVHKGQWQEK
jgi:hypothetical protein